MKTKPRYTCDDKFFRWGHLGFPVFDEKGREVLRVPIHAHCSSPTFPKKGGGEKHYPVTVQGWDERHGYKDPATGKPEKGRPSGKIHMTVKEYKRTIKFLHAVVDGLNGLDK